jgi:hypothetical protein
MTSLQESSAALAAQAAVEAGCIKRCPLHPAEMIVVGSERDLPPTLPAVVRENVAHFLASLPTSCPRCSDADD